jgi:hypothetical protein
MPCRSDYLEPNKYEIELSRIYSSLDELKKGEYINHNGHHPLAYCKGVTKQMIDDATSVLCSILQNVDVTQFSLETQKYVENRKRL